jgi:polar amino acid transport system permease protein
MCVAKSRYIRYPTLAVVNAVRGIPLLMVIFWMYFLLPFVMGKIVPESWTVITALSLFTSAYMSQIVQAGIEGIPRGQTEAALSTGLRPWHAMVFVVLPQAIRNMIPSFVNQFVSMIKDTSLAFIVGVSELTHVATQVNNRTMIYPAEIFLFIAVIYFIICFAFTSLSRWLEQRLAWRKAI